VTERADFIARIRTLSRQVAQSYLDSRKKLGFPLANKSHAQETIEAMNKNEKK